MPVTISKKQSPLKGLVVGLDVSTKTGVMALGGDGTMGVPETWTLTEIKDSHPLKTRCMRMREVYKHTLAMLDMYKPVAVVIEGYGYQNHNTLAVLVEVGTIVRAVLYNHKVSMFEVSPNGLKKFVLGKGQGKKDQIRLGVYKKWQFEHEDDNVVDAYALARIGLCLTGQAEPKNQPEREVIEVIRKHGGVRASD